MKKYKKPFITSESTVQYFLLVLSLSIKGIVLLFPYLLQRLIDAVTVGSRADMNHFAVLSVALVFVYIPMIAYYGYKLEMSEVIMVQRLRRNLIKKMIFMDFNKYFEKEPGYFFQRFVKDCESVRYLFYERKIRLISNVVYLIAIFYMMIRYSIVLTIVSCILIVILSVLSYFYLPKISKAQNELLQKEERVTGCFEEGLSGFELVRNYQAEHYVINRMNSMLNQWRASVKVFTRKDVFYDFILALFLIQLTDSLIYWIGGDSILNGNLTFGALTAFSIYFSRLRDVVDILMGIPKKTTLAKVSEGRIMEVLSLEDEKSLNHEIEELDTLLIKDLSYEIKDKVILDQLNIRIKRGETIGLRGRNGSGKTTLARLLAKSIKPTGGEILWNSWSYFDLTEADVKKRVLLMPSTTSLFEGSIRENITLDKESSLDDFCVEILEALDLNEEATVDNAGSNFSQGQKRIVELLRTLYKDFELIIFDEPLNYLDIDKRQIFHRLVKEKFQNKTVLIISNEEEAFSNCHRVIDLKEIQNV